MICEHWKVDEDYNGSEEVLGEDCVSTPEFFTDPNNAALNVGLKRCCTIEGEDWNEVMTKYHEHMGFEPYIPW
jgi:hypothetical protein